MSEDTNTKPSEESVAAASALRKRKKRKWDEPADLLVSPIIAIPGAIPVGIGSTIGTPGVFPLSNAISTNTVLPSITQNVVTLVHKLSQPKVQDEPIAREIVINDAEPTIRYKLTKRQTQEEIQKSTGAVVITRGKYRPPTALPDSEKPLYLHISAGSHLKDMAERIIVVDRAAAMVEEILRQGHNLVAASGPYTVFNSNGQVNQPLSICLFLGFEPDPSQNIAARIRGPNDQYINHIINETGATVVLRGKGSGNHDISHPEEDQQPLHLYLSSTNSKSLEAARCLAENLLDTISAESGASRASSSKAYNAVPPPQQLLAGFQSSANMEASINPVVSSSYAVAGIAQTAQSYASNGLVASSASTVSPSGVSMQNGILSSNGNPIPNMGSYAYPTVTRGTCYSGYGGIYPQATPLQQVALALKQAPVSTTFVVSSTSSHTSSLPKTTSSSNADTEKRPPQKRKFQELPVTSKVLPTLNQNLRLGSECFKSGLEDVDARKFSSMPSPKKKLIQPGLGEQLPSPPPRMMIPPPPPKFSSTVTPPDAHNHNIRVMPPPPPKLPLLQLHSEAWNQNPVIKASISETSSPAVKSPVTEKPSAGPVSDTLLKLVEYDEEEEEDVAVSAEESCRTNLMICSSSKPFWAV